MSNLSQKESVYIIIPVHNRKALTLGCLEHLKKTGDIQRYYVVVVDDGSTDGTTEAINALYPDVTVVPGNGDLWWTGAIAQGMQYAYNQGAEYFIWLNDDCLPDANTLPQLVDFARKHPDTIVAPACYSEDSKFALGNGFKGRECLRGHPGEVTFVDGMCGWCVVIPKAVFAKIGPPDADKFPQYSGDDTYTLRATRAGFKACIVGDVTVSLTGQIRVTHNIQYYIRPGQSPAATLQALFGSKKSPYYIPTKFFYHTEKYGLIVGTLLFLIKMTLWVVKWAKMQFTTKRAGTSSG